jgi:hypothetical protein
MENSNMKNDIDLSRRGFMCGVAVLAISAFPDLANAAGVSSKSDGSTEILLSANKRLATVGGVIELNVKKYGRIAIVRSSKGVKGFSVFRLFCPHEGVIVKQSSEGWLCSPPRGHGAKFALNGKVLAGPAKRDLQPIKFTASSRSIIIN